MSRPVAIMVSSSKMQWLVNLTMLSQVIVEEITLVKDFSGALCDRIVRYPKVVSGALEISRLPERAHCASAGVN